MEIFGYICALLIGMIMGVAGSGGSILCVPIFVYLFGLAAIEATTLSLFAVGTTSIFGAISNIRRGNVNVKDSMLFGLPSVLAVILARRFVVPYLPEVFFKIGSWEAQRDVLLMILFSVLMILSAYRMIRSQKAQPIPRTHLQPEILIMQGFGIGVLTGLIGAGGGFLIVPALVILLGMPIKHAVGTSLLLVAINALAGFVTSMTYMEIRWEFILPFTAICIIGLSVGLMVGKKIRSEKLKKYFGYFVLVLGSFILMSEIFQW